MDTREERLQSSYRLRQIRESANLTQEQFAEILGISTSAYKKVESGENQVSLSCLRNLHAAMNVSTDYVLYGDKGDIDDTWCRILNCSESDKMFILMRLLSYFVNLKGPSFPLHEEQLKNDKSIMQFLRKLQGGGEG